MMAGMAKGVTLNARLPAMATAKAAAGTVGAASTGERLARIEQNTSSVDRSAHIQVNANYANQQSESDVARDVRTVLDLMGWR